MHAVPSNRASRPADLYGLPLVSFHSRYSVAEIAPANNREPFRSDRAYVSDGQHEGI